MLRIENLCIDVRQADGTIRIVRDFSLDVAPGSVTALLGESGCGKSLTALSIGRLLPDQKMRVTGKILFEGVDLLTLCETQMRGYRGRKFAYIFQEPATALNPVMRIGEQIVEVLQIHGQTGDFQAQAIDLLRDVGIPEPQQRFFAYAHELSGGMQQRAVIAMALAARPKLLIADEPTTALDVTVQAQILFLLKELRAKYGMSILLITHNFGLLGALADFVTVLYAGEAVESGMCQDVTCRSAHPYTQALIRAVPDLHRVHPLEGIPGRVPSPGDYPENCRFAPRCAFSEKCPATPPPFCEIEPGHFIRCHRGAKK